MEEFNKMPPPPKGQEPAPYTEAVSKWGMLKEKMRLYNISLTQQKNNSANVDLAPVAGSGKTQYKGQQQ